MRKILIILFIFLCCVCFYKEMFIIENGILDGIQFYVEEVGSLFNIESNSDSFLVLEIPKISLRKDIYELGSELNNVDYNVELLKESNLSNNLFFLAGHSGNGRNCFFNDLVSLDIGDKINIYVNHQILVYEVDKIYFIDKTGVMDVEVKSNRLFLITCSLVYYNKQLVIEGNLIEL